MLFMTNYLCIKYTNKGGEINLVRKNQNNKIKKRLFLAKTKLFSAYRSVHKNKIIPLKIKLFYVPSL